MIASNSPSTVRKAAHAAAVAKLNSIYSGQIPERVAREIADAALDAAARQIHDINPDRSADFSEGIDWVLDEIGGVR